MRRLKKKITSIVLLASFTASLSSMALAADVGTVTDDCVRLRREASTSSDSLGMLVKGDKVSILDQEDNGWLKITYTDSEGTHTGYVSGEFVKTNSTKKTDSKKNTSKDTKKTTKAKADTTAKTTKTTKKVKKQQAAADTSAVSLGTGTVTNGGKKYKEINLRAMKMLPKGGYLVTCSCSQHVSPEAFTDMLLDAARDAHRQLRLIESRTQGKDHPILLAAPETRYLKFMVFQVF